jgi:hypothetical protein
MQLVVSGLVVSVVLGAFAMGVVMRWTRGRLRAPLPRGRVERAVAYGAALGGGLLTWLTLLLLCPEVTPASQEAALLGVTVAMPVSAAATWAAGELVAGPTQGSWRPMMFAFLAAQVGFMAPMVIFPWFDRQVLRYLAGEAGAADALVLSAELVTSLLFGGLASAWAYRRWRRAVALPVHGIRDGSAMGPS